LLFTALTVPCCGWETTVYAGVAESFHARELNVTVVARPGRVRVDCARASNPGMVVGLAA
jgi:hypothetical protein